MDLPKASDILNFEDEERVENLDFEGLLDGRSDHELEALRNSALRMSRVDGEPTFLFLFLRLYLESKIVEARDVSRSIITKDNMGMHNYAKGQIEVLSPLLSDGLGMVDLIDKKIMERKQRNMTGE